MRLLLVLAVVLGLSGLFIWGSLREEKPLPSALVGRTAPDFTLPLLEPYRSEWGDALALSNHLGEHPIILNFWASWCPPCRDEAPMLETFWRSYESQVLLLGVNVQDSETNALAFIREFNLSFPSVVDPRNRLGIDYGAYGLPETFFIDSEGKVMARHVGYLSAEQLSSYLELLELVPAGVSTIHELF